MAQRVAFVRLVAAQVYKGRQIEKQKTAESQAYTEAGKRRMAATTLDVAEEQRRKEYMHSRALAVAAANDTILVANGTYTIQYVICNFFIIAS